MTKDDKTYILELLETITIGVFIMYNHQSKNSDLTYTAQEALNNLCHTSQRNNKGTTYTIEDIRCPKYNGKQIFVELVQGRDKFNWID